MSEITYRAVPDDTDFETRHEAVGYAAILNNTFGAFEFDVRHFDEKDRETSNEINRIIESKYSE